MICLVQELHSSPDIKLILTMRFTQDALENLFSQIRGQGAPHPQPVQFRQALCLVCHGHFMMMPTRLITKKTILQCCWILLSSMMAMM